jgi:hypothetical protein
MKNLKKLSREDLKSVSEGAICVDVFIFLG